MPRFAASLSMMFGEVELPERFAAAERAGFRGVEIQNPYEHDAGVLRRLAVERSWSMPRLWTMERIQVLTLPRSAR